jgi:hypothetical protein
MPTGDDHERLSKQLNRELTALENENERLEGKIEQVRSQWKAKRRDSGVPGAQPESDQDGASGQDDEVGDDDDDNDHLVHDEEVDDDRRDEGADPSAEVSGDRRDRRSST